MDQLYVTVGNEAKYNAAFRRIPLQQYLQQFSTFNRRTYNESSTSLLLPRDTLVLTSAQACMLPLESSPSATTDFVPEIFSYQSTNTSPAVLAIIASAQGTSAQVLRSGKQPLFFNRGDVSVKFTARRLIKVGVACYTTISRL